MIICTSQVLLELSSSEPFSVAREAGVWTNRFMGTPENPKRILIKM